MAGRREDRRERWYTDDQRLGVEFELLAARLPREFAPEGYEDVRGPLWSDFTARRTVPDWDDFEAEMNELRAILWDKLDSFTPQDASPEYAALLGAAHHLQCAWNIASAAK